MKSSELRTVLERIRGNDRGLTELDLSRQELGDEEVKALAEALKANHTVLRLALRNNAISDEGAFALAGMLKENDTLSMLDLANNAIGVRGVQVLIDALKNNRSITDLYFRENPGTQTRFLNRWLKETGNKNIILFSPHMDYCRENTQAAVELLYEIRDSSSLGVETLQEIRERIPALVSVMDLRLYNLDQESKDETPLGEASVREAGLSRRDITTILKKLKAIAKDAGITLPLSEDLHPFLAPLEPSPQVDNAKGTSLSDQGKKR